MFYFSNVTGNTNFKTHYPKYFFLLLQSDRKYPNPGIYDECINYQQDLCQHTFVQTKTYIYKNGQFTKHRYLYPSKIIDEPA